MISSKWFRLSSLLLGAAISVMVMIYIDRAEHRRAAQAFDSHADQTIQALTHRLDGYARTLDGAAALFAASSVVTAQDWRNYVVALEVDETLPGILGVGFITLLRESGEIDLSEQMLHRGLVLPPIHPDTGLDERFVVQFIEPLAANHTALGLDMGFEPERRRAAQIARETNTVQLTPPIELVQNDGRELGFLLLRPLYAPLADLTSAQTREAAFEGWVYMPFIGEALFTFLTAHQDNVASLSVWDDATLQSGTLVFDNAKAEPREARFSVLRDVDILGRNWTMRWDSTSGFEQANTGPSKWIAGALAMMIFGLIAHIAHVVSSREERIERDVTRKTEELSAKAEETLSVIDNAVIAIFVLDENDRILSANQAATQLFPGRVLTGATIRDFVVPKDGSAPAALSALSARSPVDPALRLRVQTNEWTTENGAARSTLLVQDVSESEAGARKLQANEARWNLALEGAHIGVFDINLVTNKSVVSDTWRKLMRVPLDATDLDTQKLFLSRIHPEDLKILNAADQACIDGITDRSVAEYRMQFEDGSMRWMKSDAVVVARDAAGTALRLVGAQTDMTDLREAQAALRASRERFELVLAQAPVGMALLSSDGRFLGMNDALCRMTGYVAKEIHENMRFRDLVSPADFAELTRQINSSKAEKQSSYQSEYQIIPKNGPPIWGLLSVAWTYDAIEASDVFIVQINDITEKKNIEKMKSEFVATVSHELRTPLTSIKGALGLMRGPMLDKMPAGADRLLEIAKSNAERLSALVNDILDLEKIRSGDVEFYIEPVVVQDLLTDGIEQMQPFAVQHKVEFVLEAPNSSIIALIDPQRTQQVIANLLSNACKYSDDDTKVHVRLETIDGRALICVLNTGPVISDEFKTKIFRPFSQADASDTRAKGGTGLGLNISRQIVERMNGKIGFKSDSDAPTAFWFTVPLAQASLSPKKASQQTSKPTFKVLHLEDDGDFSEIIRKSLGHRANLTSALTVSDARLALVNDRFDLVVIDWELPDGHGSDILDDVVRYQPHARIMSLSAQEASVRDLRVDYEIVKSRTDLDHIVSKMVKYSRSA